MADPVIPKEALDVVARALCVAASSPEAPACTELCTVCKDEGRAAILAYHADLARRGLKVVAREPTQAMHDKAVDGENIHEILEGGWDAAESVL